MAHVGVGHDDHVVLGAAKALGALSRLGRAHVDVLGDLRGADEADGADVLVVEDRIHRDLVAIDDVEDARRQTGLKEDLGDPHRHGGIALGGLEDEGVSTGDGGRAFPQRDHGREIERRDAGNDPKGLAQGVDVDAGARPFGVLALEEVRDAGGEFHHFHAALNVALGVRHSLAVL